MRSKLLVPLLALALSASAQTPYLVKDLNTIGSSSPASSVPEGFIRFGTRVYFAATTANGGRKLWSTDGTPAGTALVANTGGPSPSSPSRFVVVNGKLLFNGTDIVHGEELWVVDVPQTAPHLLADIAPGLASSVPSDRILYHGKLLFAADDGKSGMELWSTDGTAAGTALLKDLRQPGTSNPAAFVELNDTVYFGTAFGFWKTNGTAAGTVQLAQTAAIYNVVAGRSRLFFSTDDGQVWMSDGTAGGTRQIATLNGYRSGKLAALGDSVLYASDRQPWISDGTAAGTHRIRDIRVQVVGPEPGDEFVVLGNVVYFSGASQNINDLELWRTDGTESGTTLVKEIAPDNLDGALPNAMTVAGDKLYFGADAPGERRTLWVTDGTSSGTRQVTAGGAPVALFSSARPVVLDGILYFDGADALDGFEPWRSDGTDAGTFMIANVEPDPPPSSFPQKFIVAGDFLYFEAWDGVSPLPSPDVQRSLWRSDGTAAGTLKLADTRGASDFAVAGRTLYFKQGIELWVSDGTAAGTRRAKDVASPFPNPPASIAVAGRTLFASVPGFFDYDLWAAPVDGSAPAVPLDVYGGYGFTDVGGATMFFTGDANAEQTLWITDGTADGTAIVAEQLRYVDAKSAAAAGGSLFFADGQHLWKSDGTPQGTAAVTTLPGPVRSPVVAGKKLFFLLGSDVWVSDGTAAGTHSLSMSGVRRLAVFGERVVFHGFDSPNEQNALYVSDGTAEGTRVLRHAGDQHLFEVEDDIASDGTAVYFTLTDLLYGAELWTSDGTAEGTRLLADLEPGKPSSDPQYFVKAGDRVFFAAATAANGAELWALPAARACLRVGDIRVPEGDSGTTAARFAVSLSSAAAQSVSVEYATSDGSAQAGRDYDAASGTLTFAPGETAKTVDVRVHGNADPDSNRTFFLTLRNAAGASLEKPVAFAVIDDDDQFADLRLGLDFSNFLHLRVLVNATNDGTVTATNVKTVYTATPASLGDNACFLCTNSPSRLAPGSTERMMDYSWFSFPQYITAAVSAHQRDKNPANNSVAWVTNGRMAMDALYLTPGGQANVYYGAPGNFQVTSSDPAVVSVPATAQNAPGSSVVQFVATGMSVGAATIVLHFDEKQTATLTVNVLPPGAKPRWPGGVNIAFDPQVAFDKPVVVSIESGGSAPYTGAHATGTVAVALNGREVVRGQLDGTARQWKLPVYTTALGSNSIAVSYSGDATFLPVATQSNVQITPGAATIAADPPRRSGTSATLHITVTGSPAAAPTGTVAVGELGEAAPQQVTLVPSTPAGVSTADVTLTNLAPDAHTIVLSYSGDGRYKSGTQNVRLADPKPRAVRH